MQPLRVALALVGLSLLAACHTGSASLRGSRMELYSALDSHPTLLSISERIRDGTPADRVLQLLEKLINDMYKEHLEDQHAFVKYGEQCAEEVQQHEHQVAAVQHQMGEAEAALERASHKIAAATEEVQVAAKRAAAEQGEVARLHELLEDEGATHNAALGQFRSNQEQALQALHLVEAVLAHLAVSTPSSATETSLLELDSNLAALGFASMRSMAGRARRAVVNAAAHVQAGVSGEEEEGEHLDKTHELTLKIVDMVLHLKQRLEKAHAHEVRAMEDSVRAYNRLAEEIKGKIAKHAHAHSLAVQARKDAEHAIEQARASRAMQQAALSAAHQHLEEVSVVAHHARAACESYAKEYVVRHEARVQDMRAAQAVHNLIREKQNAVKAQLAELAHEVDTAAGSLPAADVPDAPQGESQSQHVTVVPRPTEEDQEVEERVNAVLNGLPVDAPTPLAELVKRVESATGAEAATGAATATGATGATGAHSSATGSASGTAF